VTASARSRRRDDAGPLRAVVAFVGLYRPLTNSARGFLARCDLEVIELDATGAGHFLDHVMPDVLVLDGHCPALQRPSADLMSILAIRRQDRATPIVVLNAAGLSRLVRRTYEDAGAVFAPAHPSLRVMARILRRLCGLGAECCRDAISSRVR
jgi:hypothetical protein